MQPNFSGNIPFRKNLIGKMKKSFLLIRATAFKN
jgi:hypothetical protein